MTQDENPAVGNARVNHAPRLSRRATGGEGARLGSADCRVGHDSTTDGSKSPRPGSGGRRRANLLPLVELVEQLRTVQLLRLPDAVLQRQALLDGQPEIVRANTPMPATWQKAIDVDGHTLRASRSTSHGHSTKRVLPTEWRRKFTRSDVWGRCRVLADAMPKPPVPKPGNEGVQPL